ncbi:MAG: glutathione peroxidase [Pseudomonadota bacterium]
MTIYDIPFSRLDGSPAALADYRGKVLLLVNVASKCGLTPQYAGLEKLYEDKREDGLVVIGFPANDFGAQEPGSNEEIGDFCTANFGVQFPMAQKISVKGPEQHPLYAFLTKAQPAATETEPGAFRAKLEGYGMKQAQPSDVLWNFEKFLVGRNGDVVGRFNPDVKPDDALLAEAIARELEK